MLNFVAIAVDYHYRKLEIFKKNYTKFLNNFYYKRQTKLGIKAVLFELQK